jgi:hypothetical protein
VEYIDPAYDKYEVVLDNLTHLLWQRSLRDVADPLLSWDGAKTHCDNLSIPGYPSGWRLPTRIELASLVDYSKILPAPSIDKMAFPWPMPPLDARFETFWSSSADATTAAKAWVIAFNGGFISPDLKNDPITVYNVRCVH